MGRQQRQRPISCHLCRVRKLRCSRQFPCSNCTSRGVACQQGPEAAAAAPSATPGPQRRSVAKDVPPASEMLSRLEKLEAVVASQAKELESRKQPSYPVPRPSVAASSSSPIPVELQRLTAEALWLEETCTTHKSAVCASHVADNFVFRTCPIRLIPKQPSFLFHNAGQHAPATLLEPTRCVWLPRRHDARILIQKYREEITHFHPIVNCWTLPGQIEALYDAVDSGVDRIELGVVVLLLSICATVSFSWTPQDEEARGGLFSNSAEANAQSNLWLKASLDVLDHAERVLHTSLESVQGVIILFFVTCNVEGISKRARVLVARSITMARELSLHRIDYSPITDSPPSTHLTQAQAEMGRRVWWYLVATDWMMGQFFNPDESVYTVHPDHMVVNRPRNIRDEDLIDGKEIVERPPDEPTDVTYLLQRLRLAETLRELSDLSPMVTLSPGNLEYDHVLATDAKLNSFIEGVPPVLRIDYASQDHPSIAGSRMPGITVQRFSLNLLVLRQQCKLHLPFLARSVVDAEYAYSRQACLDSAKTIIRIEKLLRAGRLAMFSSRLRIITVLRSVFLAAIALVLDACLSTRSGETWDTEAEVVDAWIILDEAQSQSQTAGRLLELSMQVLQTHNVPHPSLETIRRKAAARVPPTQSVGPLPMTPDSAYRTDQDILAGSLSGGTELDTAFLERQWQALEGRMDLDAIDWDRLFWGLDTPFI